MILWLFWSCEGGTLQEILRQLQAPDGALVIMDAGIASEANLHWLTANKYNRLVVSRKKNRDIDMAQTSVIQSAGGHQIHLQWRPANIPQKSNSPVGRSKGL